MKIIIVPIVVLLVMNLVLAIPQPVSDNLYVITQPEALPTGIDGQTCYEQYSTTNGYCSVNIREYHQCLQRMEGLIWVQQSENCGSNGMTCQVEDGKATCAVQTPNGTGGFSWTTIGIIAGIILLIFLLTKRKR